MKNFCIIFLSFVIIIVTAVGFSGGMSNGALSAQTPSGSAGQTLKAAQPQATDYLRIHIRADSNEEKAQAVKYEVRDRIVEYLTPVVANCDSKAQALKEIEGRLPKLEELAGEVLQEEGFIYGASASLKTENFPTRVYGEYVLPAGEYSALVLALGSGKGDNWWCVVYPPLCFTAGNGRVVYKSKIKEIIRRFYAR